MNWMLRSKVLDDLYGRNHITISRNNYGDVAALGKQINKHTRCNSYIRLFLLVSLNLKTAVLALNLLFL